MKDGLVISNENKTIKEVAKLKLKKYRKSLSKCIVESYYPILYALDGGYKIETLFVFENFFRKRLEELDLIKRLKSKNVKITYVSEKVFKKISYITDYDGLLAIVKTAEQPLDSLKANNRGMYLILESIEQVSNLGSLIRVADNAGVSAVIIANERVDIYNPGVIRSSVGTVFTIPIFNAGLEQAQDWCLKNNIETLVTSPGANKSLYEISCKDNRPIAIVVGNEYKGVSESWQGSNKYKAKLVKIPMFGKANSMNVTASAAVILYEVLRQRKLNRL